MNYIKYCIAIFSLLALNACKDKESQLLDPKVYFEQDQQRLKLEDGIDNHSFNITARISNVSNNDVNVTYQIGNAQMVADYNAKNGTKYQMMPAANFSLLKNTSIIKKGSIYAAHPCLHPELAEFFEPIKSHTSTKKFLSWIYNFFGLEISHKVKSPLFYPSITDELMDKLLCIGPLNKIVLISPEAISMPALPENFWIRLVKDIRCRDLIPVSNVIDVNNSIKGSLYVKLDINEALRLGLYCKEVHSIRSGFCDLLFSRNKDLHVYYPTEESYYIYSMNDMFERADIDECVVI